MGLFFRRNSAKPRVRDVWDPSNELIRWSRSDAFALEHAYSGTLVLGATGSGKTSGSGAAIAEAMLRKGFGGLALAAKPGERELWEAYCRKTGRLRDLVVFSPEENWRFNVLDYELNRLGRGAGMTETVVNLLYVIVEMGDRNGGHAGGHGDDQFWRHTARQLARNAIEVLAMAKGTINIASLLKLIVSAPNSEQEAASESWKANSFCYQCIVEADCRKKTNSQWEDLKTAADYFMRTYPNVASKTRSIFSLSLTAMLDVVNRNVLREAFCTTTNITPEAIEDGKIIVVDFPVKQFFEVGQFAQVLWKYAFQRSIERRDVRQSPRPVFLFADEFQFFCNSYDLHFQSTCRGFRVATVLLSQNISTIYATLGGEQKAKYEVDSLFGNLNTKILHSNGDPATNQWASEIIGRTRQFFVSANTTNQGGDWLGRAFGLGDAPQSSGGVSESYEYEVQPTVFTTLRRGGRVHGGNVDAIVVQPGDIFRDTGRIWRLATFKQEKH
jgi:Type IV secretory system Conjugative DNA transfer